MTRGGARVIGWWRAHSPRERHLFVLLGALALALIGWYGVASPLRQAVEQSALNRQRAAQLLNEVELARAELGALVLPKNAAELSDVLTLSAAEAGFILETQRQENGREVMVSGHTPDPAVLFGWIEMVGKNHGLVVADLTIGRDDAGALRVDAVLVRVGT